VHFHNRHILIDPGLALGYLRGGLLPHPRQVAAGEAAARRIVRYLAAATDVVFSHYHGDHVPLADANPYQLPLSEVACFLKQPRLYGKDPADQPAKFAARCRDLEFAAGRSIACGDGRAADGFTFFPAMPHGHGGKVSGSVMMTRIEADGEVFVHASDIQLLDDLPVAVILDWKPTILLASGPPLYRGLSSNDLAAAHDRAIRLVRAVPWCIFDHHLLRSREGLSWLEDLQPEASGVVGCAADYMHAAPRLLEADRAKLYDIDPVPPGWHEQYRRPSLKDACDTPAGTSELILT
jgi:predicted metallo-beta-lactamase superfamily hydrolase